MRIAVVGGGPGGLYFSALVKQLDPSHEVTVWERNAPDDTFGFGVVFSDETLGGIEHADPVVFGEMQRHFARWDDIDVHHRGTTTTSGGHGFAAMSRKELLGILQRRCADLGVDRALPHGGARPRPAAGASTTSSSPPTAPGRRCAPPTPTCSGRPSRPGAASTCGSAPTWSSRPSSSTSRRRRTASCRSTATRTTAPAARSSSRCTTTSGSGPSATSPPWTSRRARATPSPSSWSSSCSPASSDGHRVFANNSKWLNFLSLRNETWRHGNLVLIGDAAHTAHFSIGSGTKLAMEDALALAACLHEHARPRRRADRLRGGAPPRRPLHPARRAGQPGVVRGHRALRAPGARAVRLQHRHPQPPGHPREPAAARPGVRRRHRRVVRPLPAGARRAAAADVPLVPARAAGAEEPDHRLGDGHVLRRRRAARRLPPRPPGQQGARRRRRW